MMESIEKLRKYTLCDKGERFSAYINADEIADEIEREIESRYMLLPVDADGAPIHVHDWIEVDDKKHRVEAITTNIVYWWEEDGCHWTQSFMCRHVKPRTHDLQQQWNGRSAHHQICRRDTPRHRK